MKINQALLHAMKLLFLAFVFYTSSCVKAQPVQGVVLLDSLNLKVVKVFGTHQERGYAYGYLLGQDIHQMLAGYIKPIFGSSYANAKALVVAGNDLQIEARFVTEAQAVIDGMNAAGSNISGLDVNDLLLGNCMLDVMALMGMKAGMGCSSLMSWGDATLGTPLNGKSVISRHLDWQVNSTLIANQVMVIHQPSEAGERPWLLIGFAGMMSALSGVNEDLGIFQHMMDDYTSTAVHNQHFTPVWFAMRDALELDDYNNDGFNDVQDVKASLLASSNGFAEGYLISALARNNADDERVAMVAELTPTTPLHTFRSNLLPDSIPGDNLYTANWQIGRNNALHFCPRYNGIRNHIGTGTLIGLPQNWALLRDWSHLSNNIQFMQFSPEENHLCVSMRMGTAAYLNDSLGFDLDVLLNQAVGMPENTKIQGLRIQPNPVSTSLIISGLSTIKNASGIRISDFAGRQVAAYPLNSSSDSLEIPVSRLKAGAYTLEVSGDQVKETIRFIKK
jgi:hypothetical protein